MKKQCKKVTIDNFKTFETFNLSWIYGGSGGVLNAAIGKGNSDSDFNNHTTIDKPNPLIGAAVGAVAGGASS